MILRGVELRNCGRFAERFVEFRRGTNLVLGPNESGKSTLMEAIPAILFGVRRKEQFRTWGHPGECAAALTLESAGSTVRIERDILTDSVTVCQRDHKGEVLFSFEGKAAPLGRSAERTEYLDFLERLFGVADEDLFRASLFFGQGSLEIAGQGLAAKIKSLLSGFAEVDYDRVLQSLQDDFFTVTRQNPWGKDKTRDRELEELRARLAELETRWRAAQDGMRELQDRQRQIASLQEEIERDRGEFAKGERYLAWVRRQWQMEEKEEVLRRDFSRVNRQSEKVAELEKEKSRLEKELAKTGIPREVPVDLPALLAEADEIRQELIALQGESTALRQELALHANPPWKRWAFVTGVLVAAALAFKWLQPKLFLPSLAGAGILSLAVWGWYFLRALQERGERIRIKGRNEALESRREEIQARQEGVAQRLERLRLPSSAVEVVRMQKNLTRHRELADRLREVESALWVLDKSNELAGEKEELTRKMAVLDERLEKDRPLRGAGVLSPEELPEAEEKLAALGASIREREMRLFELTRREAALQGELGHLEQIEEEGERLREREARLVRRRDALGTAHDLLAEAINEFRRSHLDQFSAEVGQYLQMTTQGRYDGILLDENFAVHLKARGVAGDWHPAEEFSRGTIDAVYLAARLALTRQISRERHLPLLLDDPLVNLDRFRLGETLRMLERLGGEHQVILFSHDENLARRASRDRWHVISLEETRTSARAEERSQDAGQLHLL